MHTVSFSWFERSAVVPKKTETEFAIAEAYGQNAAGNYDYVSGSRLRELGRA